MDRKARDAVRVFYPETLMVPPCLNVVTLFHKLPQVIFSRRERVDKAESVLGASPRYFPDSDSAVLMSGEHFASHADQSLHGPVSLSELREDLEIWLLPADDVFPLRRT